MGIISAKSYVDHFFTKSGAAYGSFVEHKAGALEILASLSSGFPSCRPTLALTLTLDFRLGRDKDRSRCDLLDFLRQLIGAKNNFLGTD